MPLDLDRLEELAKAATPGPWKFSPWHIEEGPSAVRKDDYGFVCNTDCDSTAAYIAACSPDAILSVIARVRGLEACVEAADAMRKAPTESIADADHDYDHARAALDKELPNG